MTDIQTKGWDLRNVWPLSTGEIAVRPSLIDFVDIANCVGGFSVKNPRVNEVNHYVLTESSLQVYDNNWIIIQNITLPVVIPHKAKAALCYAVVEDEIIITSPYFPTYWGIIGDGLILASKVASVNPNTTAIDMPRGISVGWAGRAVICDGESLYFSDALFPRTYVAENIVVPPCGTVYGLHVNAGGALVLVGSDGVYALPEDAAASGQLVVGIFSKLTDYSAIDYEVSGTSHGRVFGLTRKGYRLIDQQDSTETILSETVLSRSLVPRIHFDDYRLGRFISSEFGPIVSIGGYAHLTDLATQTITWWHSYDLAAGDTRRFDFTGKLTHQDGSPLFLCYSIGPLFLVGNRDDLLGGFGTGGNTTEQTIASIAGRVVMSPEASPVLRLVEYDTDSESQTQTFIINQTKLTNPNFGGVTVIPVIGVNSWNDGSVYREIPLRSRRTQWSSRGNEVAMEIQIFDYPSRIPQIISLTFAGPGKTRPNQ